MKRKIFAAFLTVVLLLSFAVVGSAKTYGLVFDSSYDADKNIVTVKISVESPGALESADFCLAYDPEVYEYVDFDDSATSSDLITAVGKSTIDTGLVNCSAMFAEHCKEEDLDENGNLVLASFNFKPLTDEYDIENFCMWATSYYISNTDIVSAVTPVGNTELKAGHTAVVTVSPTTSKSANKNSDGNSKWYIYLIASVVAVGAVAGIAVIAIKSNQDQDQDQVKPEDKKEKSKGKKNTDSSDK